MATLKSMCQAVARDVADDEVAPSSFVGNPDRFAVKLLRMATKAARRVYKANDSGWTILQREYTFNTAAGTAEYALPSDFGWFVDETAWDRTTYTQMRGPMNAREWQILKSGIAVSSAFQPQWRVKRAAASVVNKFVLDPTPTTIEASVVEYVSNSWATAANGSTLRTDWVADDDIPLLDPDLIELDMTWRMLERMGKEYQAGQIEAVREIDKAIANDGGAPVLAVTMPQMRGPWVNWPTTGYGS